MQKDYALFSFDGNKLHANIIVPFFWDMTAVLFSKGGKTRVGKKGGIREKLGRERTGNPKKDPYQRVLVKTTLQKPTYSTSTDEDFVGSFGV
jgi:hypothetical protein